MRELNYYEAKFEALDEIMAGDQRVHLINGTFLSLSPHRHVYQNLLQKYRERMISPPISELGFCGLATGAAMAVACGGRGGGEGDAAEHLVPGPVHRGFRRAALAERSDPIAGCPAGTGPEVPPGWTGGVPRGGRRLDLIEVNSARR